jgi:hypothetical protein
VNGSRRALRALAIAGVLSACALGVVDPDSTDSRLRSSVVPDDSWTRVERANFSYAVPPGFLKLDVQPIDSDAATHASGSSSLHHDYGWYTGPWSRAQHLGEALSEVVEQDVRIGGRTAQVVSYRSGEVWVVRAWWGRVRVQQGQGEHLLLSGETEDIRIREILLAALYSVRFK